MGHGWYVALDKFARARFRIGSPAFIATKVVLDEGLFGPIHVLGFFAYMTLAEGGSWEVCIPLRVEVIRILGIVGPLKATVTCAARSCAAAVPSLWTACTQVVLWECKLQKRTWTAAEMKGVGELQSKKSAV